MQKPCYILGIESSCDDTAAAILENDIKIQVPPFIESGDEILVDTRTIEYIKKL